MIVQIYEIQTPAEAETMIELGVDHIGSVILKPPDSAKTALKETVAAVQSAAIELSTSRGISSMCRARWLPLNMIPTGRLI